MGFVNSKNQTVVSKDSEAKDGDSPFKTIDNRKEEGVLENQSLSINPEDSGQAISTTKDHQGSGNLQTNLEESNGMLLFK